jgi:hypothetical protein
MRIPLLRIAFATALILAIPLAMMQISDDWQWGFFDFVAMGVLLFGAGMTYELVARRGGGTAYRAATGLAVLTSVVLMWVNAAVGIIGDGPVNALYVGVIAVGIVGAAIARLKPRGMALALFAMALAQLAVPVLALVIWDPPFDPGIAPVLALNAVFALLFAGSGLLFRRARSTLAS